MKEQIEDLLFVCEVALSDNRGEKEQLLEQIVFINSLFKSVFTSNKNVNTAINYFNNILTAYIKESETEYLFFEKCINYLEYLLDNMDLADEKILLDIDACIDEIDELFIMRTINTDEVESHYQNIIQSGILTDKNYFISNFANRLNEDEKKRLLGCIPEI